MVNEEQPSEKSYVIAVSLSGIFGMVGIQHFYMGRYVEAILDLGMFLTAAYFFFNGQNWYAAGVFIIDVLHTLIVTFMLLTGTFRDGTGRLICYPGQKLKRGNMV